MLPSSIGIMTKYNTLTPAYSHTYSPNTAPHTNYKASRLSFECVA